jgi:hypothetical protein
LRIRFADGGRTTLSTVTITPVEVVHVSVSASTSEKTYIFIINTPKNKTICIVFLSRIE